MVKTSKHNNKSDFKHPIIGLTIALLCLFVSVYIIVIIIKNENFIHLLFIRTGGVAYFLMFIAIYLIWSIYKRK